MGTGNLSKKKSSRLYSQKSNFYDNVSIYYKDDSSDAAKIDPNIIQSIEIKESILTLFASMDLVLTDSGSWYYQYLLNNNDPLIVKITNIPNGERDSESDYFINARFSITNVTIVPHHGTGNIVYEIHCIYEAGSALNNIVTYPEDNALNSLVYLKRNSWEVIQDVLMNTSFGFSKEISTNDLSYWINPNMTIKDFLNKVIDHAWIDQNDAPLLYGDKDGTIHLTSIQKLAGGEVKHNLAGHNLSDKQKLLYSQYKFINAAASVLNKGGYSVNYSGYNPYNKHSQMDEVFESDGILGKVGDALSILLGNKEPAEGIRNVNLATPDTVLANVSSKSRSYYQNVGTNYDGGMHFTELHDYYEIAPLHNEQFRRSFFQSFAKVLITTNQQQMDMTKLSNRPKLGDKVFIDFSSADYTDKIHTGEYIVIANQINYIKDQPMTFWTTCVTDGYYSNGEDIVKKD